MLSPKTETTGKVRRMVVLPIGNYFTAAQGFSYPPFLDQSMVVEEGEGWVRIGAHQTNTTRLELPVVTKMWLRVSLVAVGG